MFSSTAAKLEVGEWILMELRYGYVGGFLVCLFFNCTHLFFISHSCFINCAHVLIRQVHKIRIKHACKNVCSIYKTCAPIRKRVCTWEIMIGPCRLG